MRNFFTADTHFRHTNILKHSNRPFLNIREHDEALIANWNSVVGEEDHVYHLGDFGFGSNESMFEILCRLRGKIHFIRGNHDKNFLKGKCKDRLVWVNDTKFLTVQEEGVTYKIFLSHYAHRTWDRKHYGTWHLFGHSHGTMKPHGLSFDVGVDCWNYTPISLKTISKKMDSLNLSLTERIFRFFFGRN